MRYLQLRSRTEKGHQKPGESPKGFSKMGNRVRGHVLEGESGGTGYVHLRKEAEKDDLSAYKYLGVGGGEKQRKGRDSNQGRQKPRMVLGLRTSIRKRKTQAYSSAGFLAVMSAGQWKSLPKGNPSSLVSDTKKKNEFNTFRPVGMGKDKLV